MDKAPAFLFGKEKTDSEGEKRIKVIQQMQKDLDWLYFTARDNGEKEAISFVEMIIDNWFDAELKFVSKETTDATEG